MPALSWKQKIRCRLSSTKARGAWMVWAIWGMLGTSLTMEGTQGLLGLNGLSVAGLLTAPFWLAFALWPIFYVWRRWYDHLLWAEETVVLLHDPENEVPFGLEIIVGHHGIKVAAEELHQIEGIEDLLIDVQKHQSDPIAGLPFETFDAQSLVQWGQHWLEKPRSDNEKALQFARWTDTLRYEVQKIIK